MSTLAEVKATLSRLECEVAELNAQVALLKQRDEADRNGSDANGLRPVDQEALRQTFDELMKRIGAEHLKPIGVRALRARMMAQGIRPEDCIGSRGITEMREE